MWWKDRTCFRSFRAPSNRGWREAPNSERLTLPLGAQNLRKESRVGNLGKEEYSPGSGERWRSGSLMETEWLTKEKRLSGSVRRRDRKSAIGSKLAKSIHYLPFTPSTFLGSKEIASWWGRSEFREGNGQDFPDWSRSELWEGIK